MFIYILLFFYNEHILPRNNWVQEMLGNRRRECSLGLKFAQGQAPH